LVGNDKKWFVPLAAQQPSKESLRGALITAPLNQNIDHVAVLIHGAPQILLFTVDSNEDFVQVPNIAEAALTPLQLSGIVRTELLTPNRIVSYETMIPRSARRSSTSRKLRQKRW